MKLVSVVLLAGTIVAGCGMQPILLKVDGLERSEGMKFEDLRPKDESEKKNFSLIITNDAYGILRFGENVTSPSGPRLLAHHLSERAQMAGQVPPMKLHHFVIYENYQAALRKTVLASSLFGVFGAAATGPIKSDNGASHTIIAPEMLSKMSGDDEFKRALYSESEAPKGSTVVVIFIDSEIGSQRRSTRTVFPLPEKTSGNKPIIQLALESAIQFHLTD